MVVGYNNVRIFDVLKIRQRCREHLDAGLVLVVEQERPGDRESADLLLCTSFEPALTQTSLRDLLDTLATQGIEVEGVLPFSDRGVPLGTALAAALGLPGGDPARAAAGLDKATFRALEQASPTHPDGYLAINCTEVGTFADFERAVRAQGGRAFVKPAREGNSRGCRAVHRLVDCEPAWRALAPYQAGGVVVEALVEAQAEYSVDHIAGFGWVTEKTTTVQRYSRWCQRPWHRRIWRPWRGPGGTCGSWCPSGTVPSITRCFC
jgi:hypothetical protein